MIPHPQRRFKTVSRLGKAIRVLLGRLGPLGRRRDGTLVNRVRWGLGVGLALIATLGLAAVAVVSDLQTSTAELNRYRWPTVQLANAITRRTLSTGLRAYQAVSTGTVLERPADELNEIDILVDNLRGLLRERPLPGSGGQDRTSRLLGFLDEIHAARSDYTHVLVQLMQAPPGGDRSLLLYRLGAAGDVLVSRADAFERAITEEVARQTGEALAVTGAARAGMTVLTVALVALGSWLVASTLATAKRVARRVQEAAEAVWKDSEGSQEMTSAMRGAVAGARASLEEVQRELRSLAHESGQFLASIRETTGQVAGTVEEARSLIDQTGVTGAAARGMEQVVAVCRAQLLTGSTHVRREVRMAEENLAVAEEAARVVERLQERVEEAESILRHVTGIVDQTSFLALAARLESQAVPAGERGGGEGLATLAEQIGGLADRGALSIDEIRGELAQVREAAGGVVLPVSRAVNGVRDLARHATHLESSFEAVEAAFRELNELIARVGAAASDGSACSRRVEQALHRTARFIEEASRQTQRAGAAMQRLSEVADPVVRHHDALAQEMDRQIRFQRRQAERAREMIEEARALAR
ncbi:methyl-accepting chemotaxis protein [Limnochorda pilosa]|uniref:Methyl-accepting chemotaxis protein n=1 Tax=Limnochorda pilosa TaxID=1555112 RepID=A0A0K2SJ52_LIMPI|nr:methyl-accepting chemotaxis protein [Limnochorda pilosa]BAS27133.1 methyl-accepting chemotaxis protein [Limnochorda pilosa]